MLAVRVASGLVAAAVLLVSAWWGGWCFAVFALFVMGVCFYEFFGMFLAHDRPSRIFGLVLGLLLATWVMTGGARAEGGLAILAGTLLLPAIWFLFRPGELETVASRMALTSTGLLWIGGLGSVTSSLVYLADGFFWLLLAAVLAFFSDIGAYAVGRWLGRHKLYPVISPNKTWEGAIGGVMAATGMAVAQTHFLAPQVSLTHILVLAPLAAALGQMGDLSESMLKRSVGVKDSGQIMPGHGGLFDRIDALLFLGPVVFLYARVVLGVPITWLPT